MKRIIYLSITVLLILTLILTLLSLKIENYVNLHITEAKQEGGNVTITFTCEDLNFTPNLLKATTSDFTTTNFKVVDKNTITLIVDAKEFNVIKSDTFKLSGKAITLFSFLFKTLFQ